MGLRLVRLETLVYFKNVQHNRGSGGRPDENSVENYSRRRGLSINKIDLAQQTRFPISRFQKHWDQFESS